MKKRGKVKSKGGAKRKSDQARQAMGSSAALQVVVKPQFERKLDGGASRSRLPVGLSWNTYQVARSAAYGPDERRALIQLAMPLLLLATVLALNNTFKAQAPYLVASAPQVSPAVAAPQKIVTLPLALPTVAPKVVAIAPPAAVPVAIPPRTAMGTFVAPSIALPTRAPDIAALATLPAPVPLPSLVRPLIVPDAPFVLPSGPPQVTAAMMPVPPALACVASPPRTVPSGQSATIEFGTRLAEAAKAQTENFVIYSATYKRIAYPMGDIPSLYGSCSDVVIRAYRILGIDLQELVQKAKVGSGDPNIDHRRTETLRLFFARYGEKFSPSNYGEDYRPGDIVTYFRPYSRVSKAHIAVVSDVIGPSGNPMIVHNRGWGPQLEDALFVDRITGHYRFNGAPGLTGTGRSAPDLQARVLPGKSAPAKSAVLPAKRASIEPTVR